MPKILTQDEIIEKFNVVHKNKYNYSLVNYISSHTKVKIICPVHGIFEQTPNNHLRKRGCRICSLIKKQEKFKKPREKFIKDANRKHNEKYNYSKVNYINAHTKVIIICPIHGKFEQTPNAHLNSNGCINCSRRPLKNTDIFIEQANIIHNGKYNYSLVDYINARTKIKIICPAHDVFEQIPDAHLAGHGCTKCSNCFSKKSKQWLGNFNNPNIIREFVIIINKKRYLVDGYDPTTNTIFEFNGDYWHGNPNKFNLNDLNKRNKKTFGQLYKKTLKRENDLKISGYNVISIWEQDFDEIIRKSINKFS